jgi:large subunit ribosomal protein L35
MPKVKTHSGAAKRFKVTGTGKLMRRRANNNHHFGKKSKSRLRRLDTETEVTGADAKHVRRLMGA